MTDTPQNRFDHYHAHIYFDARTVDHARRLRDEAGEWFDVEVGSILTRPVGPHPHWSCQLKFDRQTFDALIPWLDQHRDGLTILVHGDTGDDYADHTEHAAWLGEPAALKLDGFRPDS